MGRGGRLGKGLGVLLGLVGLLGVGVAESRAGAIQFSRLTACPESGQVTFLATDSGSAWVDTLCLDPGKGRLLWSGGPIRGLAGGDGDTVYAATLAGVLTFSSGRQISFQRWKGQGTTVAGRAPDSWPGAPGVTPRVAPVLTDEIYVFPERYWSGAGGSTVFLSDAEYESKPGIFLYDLHSRDAAGVEWLLRRDLEVRGWVLSPDSLHWAVIAMEHRRDYGGETKEVALVGQGHRLETFMLGMPAALLWDGASRLWHLNTQGELHVIQIGSTPVPDADSGVTTFRTTWSATRAPVRAESCGCDPGEPEQVWAWMAPGRYTYPGAAWRHVREIQSRDPDGLRRAWVVETHEGWRAVWGGFLGEDALRSGIPEPPVPGALATQVPVDPESFTGTVTRIQLNRERGEASLRLVSHAGESASEIWWRYLSTARWVRMAGPWG